MPIIGIDLGTSNSAAAVMRGGRPVIIPSAEGVTVGGGIFEVKATSGDTKLGGTDMDRLLVGNLAERFCLQTGVDLARDRTAMTRLREAAGAARRSCNRNDACETMTVTIQTLKTTPLYSEDLGIDLGAGKDSEYFKWFLASLLFGGHISETIAAHTYEAFRRHRLLRPDRILRAGWSYLVNPIMREGGYVRYDGRKSTQVLRDCETLMADYRGSLTQLHAQAKDADDLEDRLQDFYGVGSVTANIFLRELRPYWRKADPDPLPIVGELAAAYGVDLSAFGRKTLTFARIEAGLIRLRHGRRKGDRAARPA